MSASAHEPLAASVVSIVIEFDTSANLHASYYSFSLKEQPLPDTTRVTEAAAYIASEYKAHRMIEPFPQYLGPQGIEEAYAVQQAYLEMLSKTRGPFGGYKIAYTTATMRDRLGIDQPALGRIFAAEIRKTPATLNAADYVKLGVECEVAVRLSADLPASGAPYTRESVTAAIGEVMAGIEVIDSRGPESVDGLDRIHAGIALNISSAGAVLGQPVANWRDVDIAAARGVVEINGSVVGEGRGSDVMGHPFEALAWLANALAEKGASLAAGMVVITGSIVTPKFVEPGDTAVVRIDGLGEARFTVR